MLHAVLKQRAAHWVEIRLAGAALVGAPLLQLVAAARQEVLVDRAIKCEVQLQPATTASELVSAISASCEESPSDMDMDVRDLLTGSSIPGESNGVLQSATMLATDCTGAEPRSVVAKQAFVGVHTLKLADCEDVDAAWMKTLGHCPQLTALSLAGCPLSQECVSLLAELASQLELAALNVSQARISVEGAEVLCAQLKHNETLRSLNLSANQLGAQGAQTVADALAVNTALSSLDISKNRLGALRGTHGARHIANALQLNTTLAQLTISGDEVYSRPLALDAAMTRCDMSESGVEPAGAILLAAFLPRCRNLTCLNVLGNSIGPAQAQELVEAMDSHPHLRTLCGVEEGMSEVDVSHKGLTAGCFYLMANELNAADVTTLDISNNYASLGGMGGIVRLSEVLATNGTLTFLNISRNDLTGEYGTKLDGLEAFGRALETNTTLATLLFSGNNVNKVGKGMDHLGPALVRNRTLRRLDLSANSLSFYGGVAKLVELVDASSGISELDLSGNGLKAEHCAAIGAALAQNKTLLSLNISKNEIGIEGAECIATALVRNATITSINVSSAANHGFAIAVQHVKTAERVLVPGKKLTRIDVLVLAMLIEANE
jgi:Ran GTPase-activating protein (RanGAP) involved in mRNA processing and transport